MCCLSTRHAMFKYATLLMKTGIDGLNNYKAKANFDLFHDVQIMLGFVTIPPLLCSVNSQFD